MGTPRKQTESLRSGRIKAENSAGSLSLPIIKRPGKYRILNTGESEFSIKPDGGTAIPLKSKNALDIEITTGIDIEKTAAGAIDGVYDLLDTAKPIRGGRFKGPVTPAPGITIAQNRGATFYRIFNSGKNRFNVNFQGTSIPVRQRMTIDVAAGAVITITNPDTGSIPVQGIFDYLDPRNEIRSGRFKIKKDATAVPPVDPLTPHPIINLFGTLNAVGYRIFNTGENPIVILEGTTTLHTLNSDESLDFVVGSNRQIFVKSTTSNKPIEGIYDYLGPV